MSYPLGGYVPYTSEATEIRSEGQLVTVSLSPIVEATGDVARDVRIILNWGSREDQVRDADSHLACACADGGRHVYFRNRVHEIAGHAVELDVDDTDWGGPETITLTQPVTGSYTYWVHDYSGPPALLGRLRPGGARADRGQPAGEFRVFKGLTRRDWRPFKAIRSRARAAPRSCAGPRTSWPRVRTSRCRWSSSRPSAQAPTARCSPVRLSSSSIGLLIFVRQRRKARRA